MAPKEQKQSKKAKLAKQDRVIDDLTFGLKNKNKSKKVQQFIERAEKNVKNNFGALDAAKAKEAKKDAKLAKQLQEEEMKALFNEAIMNQHGKKKTQNELLAKSLGIAEPSKEIIELLEQLSSDDEDDEENDPNDGVIYIPDEPVAIEIFRERTIEDIIEEQRSKLQQEGKAGTPVTAESFAKWRAAKLAKRQADAEARMKAEALKKKGGKGLSILSGKELFNYNSSLFIDDDAAISASEETALNEETKLVLAEEESQAKIEAERAQEEQLRLVEIHRIEMEELQRRYDEWRALALEAKKYFLLGDIRINEVVFSLDDNEDLNPFPEIVETDPTIEIVVGGKVVDNDDDDDDDDCDDDDDSDDDDSDDDDDDNEEEEEEEEEDVGEGKSSS